jgi:hypothetical protein
MGIQSSSPAFGPAVLLSLYDKLEGSEAGVRWLSVPLLDRLAETLWNSRRVADLNE